MENAIEIVHVTKKFKENPRHHRAEWVRQDGAL